VGITSNLGNRIRYQNCCECIFTVVNYKPSAKKSAFYAKSTPNLGRWGPNFAVDPVPKLPVLHFCSCFRSWVGVVIAKSDLNLSLNFSLDLGLNFSLDLGLNFSLDRNSVTSNCPKLFSKLSKLL
jgi:hypothetical protein